MACRWKECYEEGVIPISGINIWKKTKDVKVLPPPDKVPKGRQASNRRRLASWKKKPKHSKKPKIQIVRKLFLFFWLLYYIFLNFIVIFVDM